MSNKKANGFNFGHKVGFPGESLARLEGQSTIWFQASYVYRARCNNLDFMFLQLR
jgi:hypothetical protein